MTEKSKSNFWQEWRQLIIFFGGFLSLLLGIAVWAGYQANQPIDPIYAQYLGQLGEISESAQAYRDKYFQYSKRNTVASQDFLMVCAGMTYAAKGDGVDVHKINDQVSEVCENAAVYIHQDFLR